MECSCGNILEKHDVFTRIVYYCDSCGFFKIEVKQCDHELVPVKIIISNDSIQLRLLCKNCFYLDPKPKKLSDYPKVTVTKRLEAINDYKIRMELPTDDLIKELREKHGLSFREEYEKYIHSEEWYITREKILTRDGHKCRICLKKATDVHHLTYAHFKHEFDFELISLCHECHIGEYHLEKLQHGDCKTNGQLHYENDF